MTETFGKYVLLEKIGVGGMAEVFKAVVPSENRPPVAIKRILPRFCSDRKLVSMLINEARIISSLKHPNIVPIQDFGLVNDTYFIAMLYVDGKDLREIMQTARMKNMPIPVIAALEICRQVLSGLDYAHNKKDTFNNPLEIVHRDVSPANIMLCRDGTVKILDFGIAKAAAQIGETQAGILKGKFSYMSPEQARGEKLDRRSDVFAVGVLLYEMLALENLFLKEDEIQTLQAVRKAKVPSIRSKRKDVPKKVERIIKKALKKNKERRFQSAAEFIGAIEDAMRDLKPQNGRAALKQMLFDLFPRFMQPSSAEDRTSDFPAASVDQIYPISGEKRAAPPPQSPAPMARKKQSKKTTPKTPYVIAAAVTIAAATAVWLTKNQLPVENIKNTLAKTAQTLSTTIEKVSGTKERKALAKGLAEIATNTIKANPPKPALSPQAAKTLASLPFAEADAVRVKIAETVRNYIQNKITPTDKNLYKTTAGKHTITFRLGKRRIQVLSIR